MAEELSIKELDRWHEMKVLRAQGFGFSAMVPHLIEAGLLVCQDHPASRLRRVPGGGTVCTICENTVLQFWHRNLPKLSADEADIMEVKWEWLRAHREIERVCIERLIQVAEISTTRTEMIDGKEVQTLTVRKETRINVALLRLRAEIQDKLARAAGYDVDVVIPPGRMRRPVMRVTRLDANGERSADDRPN